MRLVLYARELRASGGRSVGIGMIKALASRRWKHDIFALVPDDEGYRELAGGSVQILTADTRGGAWQVLAHKRLRGELATLKPDALYMLGNRALTHAPCRQAVYFHQPWAVYPNSTAWGLLPLRSRLSMRTRVALINKSLKHADVVSAQTPVMMDRLHNVCGVPRDRLVLIPNAITPLAPQGMEIRSQAADAIRSSPHKTKAICVARHMVHKNLEILLDVADVLLRMGRSDVGIFVTVDASHGSGARRFLQAMRQGRRGDILHNLGEIPMLEVPACYRASDAMVLPTLLESFSGTYVDAMHIGIPVITSDMDFAHTVCGDAAMYIDPLNAESIARGLLSLEDEQALWPGRVAAGKKRAGEVSMDWDTIADRVIALLECLHRGQPMEQFASSNFKH